VNLAATGGSVGYTVTNTSSTGIAITGSKFSDTLVSGSGTDILTGGLGDDTYVVDLTVTGTLQDTMTEAVSAGTDTIQLRGSSTNASATSLTLADNFENFDASNTGLSLLNLTGNTVNNRLLGNAANNVLSGGTGVDTLIGGAGNDTYIIDKIGDLVYETTTTTSGIDAGGIDLVQVGIATAGGSYTLSNFVENGTLTNTVAFNLTGNSLNNTLIGNAATNTLNGELGNDTLIGGAGVDTFVVNSGTDTITDLGTGGADVLQVGADGIVNATVKTAWIAGALSSNAGSVTITTSALAVNLTAATGTSGYSVINTGNATTLTGSGLADNLTGGIGNDTLSGGVGNDVLTGGLGNDNLTGGSGSDVFLFNTAANASTNKDMITDFVSGTDKLQFSKSIFKLGAVGNLTAAEFKSGNFTGGQDATDRIVYNTSTGALYYDADGNGVAGAVQIALIGTATHPSLAYTDIQIIA
jgi:serralysin